jgi:hypothetical protein
MSLKPLRRTLIALTAAFSVLVPAAVVGTTPAEAKPSGGNLVLLPPLGAGSTGTESPRPGARINTKRWRALRTATRFRQFADLQKRLPRCGALSEHRCLVQP